MDIPTNPQPSSRALSVRPSSQLLLNVRFRLSGSSPEGLAFLDALCSGTELSHFASQLTICDVPLLFDCRGEVDADVGQDVAWPVARPIDADGIPVA
jgi:hypothetical protein